MQFQGAAPTRRQFAFGLAGAALAHANSSIYNPKLAIHTSIWLTEAAARNKRPADIADEAFRAIERAGYRRVVLAAEFVRPEIRQKTLDRVGRLNLEPSIVCADGAMHTTGEAEATRARVVELARAFTGRAAFVAFTASPKRDQSRKTEAELDTQAHQVQMLGLDLERAGVRLLLDHGVDEMAENAREWRHMARRTEPRAVSLAVDVEAAVRGGANPWALIDTAGSRLRSVALRNTRHGVDLEELGNGDIDLELIAKMLRDEQYDGYLVVDLRRSPGTELRRGLPGALSWSRWRMQEVFGSRPGGFPVDMGPHVRFPGK